MPVCYLDYVVGLRVFIAERRDILIDLVLEIIILDYCWLIFEYFPSVLLYRELFELLLLANWKDIVTHKVFAQSKIKHRV